MAWAQVPKLILSLSLIVGGSICLAAGTDAPGSKIEVREGDLWTKVSFVRTEGRKTLIRYDDGTEEWVTADRLRGGSFTGAATPGDAAKTPADSGSAGPSPVADKSHLTIGNAVEYKRGSWNKGKITRTQRGWYLVSDDRGRESFWCEPWAIRAVGNAYDIEGGGTRSEPARLGEAAPMGSPGSAPKVSVSSSQTGETAAAGPAGRGRFAGLKGRVASPTPAARAGTLTAISFDNPADPQPGNNTPVVSAPTTRPTREFIAATVRPKNNQLTAVIPCRDTPETVLICYGGQFNQPLDLMRFDANLGRQLDYRVFGTGYRLVGAASAGKMLLTVPAEGFPKTLQLWELEAGTYKLKDDFDIMGKAFPHITYACLIDATHALYRDSGGDCYLLDLAEKRAVGFIKTAPSADVYLSPNGQVLGVITTSKTALLIRTKDFSTIGEFPEAAPKGNVTLDPSGELAAYMTGDNLARVVKVADSSVIATVTLGVAGDLAMPAPGILLVDHRLVYDARTGMPVWIYALPNVMGIQKLQLASGQAMFCSSAGATGDVCIATLPDAPARNALKAASKDNFMLTPGMRVSLNANFGQFGAEADKVADLVRKSIKASGLELSDKQEPFQISASVSQGNTETRDYASGRGPGMGPMGIPFGAEVSTVSVPSTLVTVQMTHEGKPVWSQEFRFQAGGHVAMRAGQSMQDAINEASRPSAAGMGSLAIPGYLPKGAVPGTPAALGASELSPRGFVPTAKPQPSPSPSPSPSSPGNRPGPAPRPAPVGKDQEV